MKKRRKRSVITDTSHPTKKRRKRRKTSSKKVRKSKTKTQRKTTAKKRGRKQKNLLREFFQNIKLLLLILLVTVVVSASSASYFYSLDKVSGYGMMPTLRDQDVLLIGKRSELKRFDIVLTKHGQEGELRRIIGLPGEKIEYKDDVLYVNSEPLDEKFLVDKINESQSIGKTFTEDFSVVDITKEMVVAENSYLVLGDNRPFTTDSRDYGLLEAKQIVGRVNARILPIEVAIKF